jgi:hypothetical protein
VQEVLHGDEERREFFLCQRGCFAQMRSNLLPTTQLVGLENTKQTRRQTRKQNISFLSHFLYLPHVERVEGLRQRRALPLRHSVEDAVHSHHRRLLRLQRNKTTKVSN